MTNGSRHIERFLRNPITTFVLVVAIAVVMVCFVDRAHQIYGIVGLFLVFGAGSIIYALWQEKVSSARYRDENTKLSQQIRTITAENAQLAATASQLESEVPKVISFASVYKKIRITDGDGNAEISLYYDGTNVSGMPMARVRHLIFTENPLTTDRFLQASINKEEVTPQLKCEAYGKLYRSEVVLEAVEAIPDENPITTSYQVLLEKEYIAAFTEDGMSQTEHSIYLRTNTLTVQIQAPENYYFPNPRVEIRDHFNGMEIHGEESRLQAESGPRLDSSRQKLLWVIPNPRIAYSYAILFSLRKGIQKEQ